MSNKYYSCQVDLQVVVSVEDVTDRDLERCEAYVVYADPFRYSDHFPVLEAFSAKLDAVAETKLLAVQKMAGGDADQFKITTWASKNGETTFLLWVYFHSPSITAIG